MTTEEHTWGWLEQFEKVGELGDNTSDYKQISYDEAKSQYTGFTHAAHGMIYATDDRMVFDLYKSRAAILMQVRFDGVLGFPGGLVDPGEEPVEAVNREMVEEINLDLNKHKFTDANHLLAYVHHKKKLVLHFYVIKCNNLEEFKDIEVKSLSAKEYGCETFGVLRPPLFTMGDSLRGFPAFLANQFAGNARDELLAALLATNVMTQSEIDCAVNSMLKYKASI